MKKKLKETFQKEEITEILLEIEEKCDIHCGEQKTDDYLERQIEFLSDCMEENLEHARHVENERMNFMQIYLVLVGGVLTLISTSALEEKNIVVFLILIVVAILGGLVKALLYRWNQVFIAYRTCAMHCYNKIAEACGLGENTLTEFPLDILPRVKMEISPSAGKQIPYYPFTFSKSGKTEKIIKYFMNSLIILTLIVAVVYFLKLWRL